MRRKDREITDFGKIIDIIRHCDCCRLGLVDAGEAYIVPMNFGWEAIDDRIILYFHCAGEGRKLTLLHRQSSVSFEMDTGHALVRGETACSYSYLYQSVMGTGQISILTDPDEKRRALQRIIGHYAEDAPLEMHAQVLEKTIVLRLCVDTLSCKAHEMAR